MSNLQRIINDLNTSIGEKQLKKRKQRRSTRADGTNPRSKGTNPRSKNSQNSALAVDSHKQYLVTDYDEQDWAALIDCHEKDLEEVEEHGKAFLRVN